MCVKITTILADIGMAFGFYYAYQGEPHAINVVAWFIFMMGLYGLLLSIVGISASEENDASILKMAETRGGELWRFYDTITDIAYIAASAGLGWYFCAGCSVMYLVGKAAIRWAIDKAKERAEAKQAAAAAAEETTI